LPEIFPDKKEFSGVQPCPSQLHHRLTAFFSPKHHAVVVTADKISGSPQQQITQHIFRIVEFAVAVIDHTAQSEHDPVVGIALPDPAEDDLGFGELTSLYQFHKAQFQKAQVVAGIFSGILTAHGNGRIADDQQGPAANRSQHERKKKKITLKTFHHTSSVFQQGLFPAAHCVSGRDFHRWGDLFFTFPGKLIFLLTASAAENMN
jgi:hypothetical protein